MCLTATSPSNTAPNTTGSSARPRPRREDREDLRRGRRLRHAAGVRLRLQAQAGGLAQFAAAAEAGGAAASQASEAGYRQGRLTRADAAHRLPRSARRDTGQGDADNGARRFQEGDASLRRRGGAGHRRREDGRRTGLTATAVCSLSDDPPSLLVCVNRNASAHPRFARNGALASASSAKNTCRWR